MRNASRKKIHQAKISWCLRLLELLPLPALLLWLVLFFLYIRKWVITLKIHIKTNIETTKFDAFPTREYLCKEKEQCRRFLSLFIKMKNERKRQSLVAMQVLNEASYVTVQYLRIKKERTILRFDWDEKGLIIKLWLCG